MTPYRLMLLDLAYRTGEAVCSLVRWLAGLCTRITLTVSEGPDGLTSAAGVRYELQHLLLEALAERAERAMAADPNAEDVTVRPWPWLRAIIPIPLEGPDEE